jgi:muramoyltetrapeptide carboxypeptidase LdcA involved in peptidoglycan recycling
LYQVKNLVYAKGELQQKRFANYLSGKSNDLFDLNYEFLQGTYLEGIVVGGNIRCFLKLAGTEFWPDMTGKILLLESYGGETGGIATAMNQLDLMGVFDQVAGVLLGTFSKYEEAALSLSVFDLLKMHISDTLPVVKTTEIGHRPDSKAIVIGRNMKLKKGDLWQIH